ncbi:hypothetical protein ASD15_22740 [Massilia sp. Root351]|jgi:hypothetical protein|uniref:hypothetical protein n=1 Tax=Massilia sp. Root351 TaxID=1736522 RepID=UPI00070A6B47|nr:hypothetical protein [Massilia sp. Root351]KQV78622.1 hypothetical protein ASD15_22740 [Massilia sp. Root351]
MKSLKLIAALTVLSAASAFASDAPKAEAQAPADAKPAPVLLASAATPAAAAGLATAVAAPLAPAKKDIGRSRAEVQREAVEAVRNHENTLSRDLSFYTR